MNIQVKLLVFVSLFTIFLGALFVSRFIMEKKSFLALFQAQAREKEAVFDQILSLKAENMQALVTDYTYWDDLVKFVASADKQWAAQNLDTTLSTFKINAVWVYNADFSLVYSVGNLGEEGPKELPAANEILHKVFAKGRFAYFFLSAPAGGLLEVRGATIHPTADAERKTAPAGYFLALRSWGEDYIKGLAELTGSTLRITPADEEDVFVGKIHPEQGAIFFSRALNGWDAKPLERINVWIESSSMKKFNRINTQHLVVSVGVILLAFILLLFFSLRWISMPLRAITCTLNTQQVSYIEKIKRQKDEFGNLARFIERFFIQNEELVRHIKQRKEAESTVKESEERLRSIMDNLGIGVTLISPQMQVLSLNNQMREWFGDIDVSGNPLCYRVFNQPAYDYKCQGCPVAIALKDGMIHEVIRKTGIGDVTKYYRLVATPLKQNNKIKAVIEIVEDITKTKRFEDRLNKINACFLQFGADPVLNIEFLTLLCGSLLEGKSVIYSRLEGDSLRRITGWNTPLDDSLNNDYAGHLSSAVIAAAKSEPFLVRNLPDTEYAQSDPNVTRFKMQTYFACAVKCRGRYTGALGVAYDKDFIPSEEDNKIICLIASAIGIEDERYFAQEDLRKSVEESEGQRRATLNILEDMDEARRKLVQANEEIKKTQSQLVQTSKMAAVGQLASGVAHEINNPLTGVLNNVQLIKIEAAAKPGFDLNDFRELLDVVEESAVRCKKITQSLLDFSHASKGKFAPVSLNDAVTQVIVLVEHEIKLQNITIERQLQSDMPAISGDSQLLQQVIFNLITNARWSIQKKTGRDGGVITINCRYEPDKKTAVLSVSDTGIGISRDNLERIFEPFFTTKPIGEGTGLGLSLVYGIINAHGGTIDVDSEVDVGTTFTISLPA